MARASRTPPSFQTPDGRPVSFAEVARRLTATPDRFLSMCKGIDEATSQIGTFVPTDVQKQVLAMLAGKRHLFVNKYRQAKVTTATLVGFTFPRVMFNPGSNGALIANTDDTSTKLMRRLLFAHKNLPAFAKVPFVKQNEHMVEFPHGGAISVNTAGKRAPGIGDSVDMLDLSEVCDWPDAETAFSEIMPGILKRPKAFAVLESTPGARGSYQYDLWIRALEDPNGYWFPQFLKWWEDPTCIGRPDDPNWVPPPNYILNNDEARLVEQYPFLTHAHIEFIRYTMSAGVGCDDYRRFRNKYPLDEYDGWLGTNAPVMPEDALKKQLAIAKKDPPEDPKLRCRVYEPPRTGVDYLITADPHGLGMDGDPAAFTVFSLQGRKEVACWDGREDPGVLGHHLMHVGKAYNNAIIAPESNAQGASCAVVIRDAGYEGLYWTNKQHPGYYVTPMGLKEAEIICVQMLREDDIHIVSKATLHQGLEYDGSRRKARDSGGGHFDRWRTVVIASDIMSKRAYVRAPTPRKPPPVYTDNQDPDCWFDLGPYDEVVKREEREKHKGAKDLHTTGYRW